MNRAEPMNLAERVGRYHLQRGGPSLMLGDLTPRQRRRVRKKWNRAHHADLREEMSIRLAQAQYALDERAELAARLIREAQERPDHSRLLACGYGVHDFEHDVPEPGYKRCAGCGATYLVEVLAEGEQVRR